MKKNNDIEKIYGTLMRQRYVVTFPKSVREKQGNAEKMYVAPICQRYILTLPKSVRKELGIKEGESFVAFERYNDKSYRMYKCSIIPEKIEIKEGGEERNDEGE